MRRTTAPAPTSKFVILPHAEAPAFAPGVVDADLILTQLIGEVQGSRALSAEAVELLRQAGLVNLYFFIKFIMGSFGEYSYLNTGLQLDMCNFRQSPACMGPGARAAACLFRGSGKTDIFTVGGGTWELTRDPSLAIGIANAKVDRAEVFTGAILATFLHNELYRLLYPKHCAFPSRVSPSRFILPNRGRYRKEASVYAMGCTGSTEGDRFDILNADDLAGLDDITAENLAASTMATKTRWFRTSQVANMRNKSSRYLLEFTTFGAESLYSDVFKNLRTITGIQDSDYSPGGMRTWDLFLRDVVEGGRITLPEVITQARLDELLASDPTIYFSQYRMRPTEGGLLEFKGLPIGEAQLVARDAGSENRPRREFFVRVPAEEKARISDEIEARTRTRPAWSAEDEVLPLADLHVVCAVDPAGTSREDAGPRTCKSAVEVWARDWMGRNYLIREEAGFFGILELFEKIHEVVSFFEGLVPWVGVEKEAMQRIIRPQLERERDVFWEEGWVGFRDLAAGGEKDARIRFTLGPLASRGLLWVCRGTGAEFRDEFAVFPASRRKKDALDASEKCLRELRTPLSPDEEDEESARSEAMAAGAGGRSAVTGY